MNIFARGMCPYGEPERLTELYMRGWKAFILFCIVGEVDSLYHQWVAVYFAYIYIYIQSLIVRQKYTKTILNGNSVQVTRYKRNRSFEPHIVLHKSMPLCFFLAFAEIKIK